MEPNKPAPEGEPDCVKSARGLSKDPNATWRERLMGNLVAHIDNLTAHMQKLEPERDNAVFHAELANEQRLKAQAEVDRLTTENAELRKVMQYLDSIAGDDFCCDLDAKAAFHPERLTEMEANAHLKLSIVYRAAHGFDKANTCYAVHENWRKQTLEEADAALAQARPHKEEEE